MILFIALALLLAGPSEADVLRTASGHMRDKHYGLAIEVLGKWVREQPDASAQAFAMLSDCLVETGKPAPAFDIVQAGLEKHPDSIALLKSAGALLLRHPRRSSQARDPLRKAIELAPRDPEAHYYYSQWACLHNQEEICIQEGQKALALDPRNTMAAVQLNTLIGIAADKLEQPQLAEAAFRKSLECNRKLGLPDPAAAYRFVEFLVKRGLDEQAHPIVAMILDHAPGFGPALLERAKSLARKGDREQAIALAEKVTGLEGMTPDKLRVAHVLLARLYFQLGREEEARRHEAWIEQHP